jgi:hypothetical protein
MKTAAPTPAELADQLMGELEAEVLPQVEDVYGGQRVLQALRDKRAALVERLEDARWKKTHPLVLDED